MHGALRPSRRTASAPDPAGPILPPRPLDPVERWCWTIGRVGAANMLLVVHGQGAPDPEGLRRAAADAQRRHPLLRARFAEAPGGPCFAFDAAPLGVRALPGAVAEAWGAAAEAELREPFPPQGPLVRLSLLRDRGPWALLMAFDHAVADGRGMFRLARELLAGQAGAAPGPVLPAPPPLGDLLPPRAGDPRLRRRALRGALGQAARRALEPRTALAEGPAAPAEKRTRAVHLRVPSQALDGLVARCRAEGATMQAALAAALLLALRDEFGLSRARTMACAHGVDLRPWLTADPGEGLGSYSVAMGTHQRVGRASRIWPLARTVKANLAAALGRGDQFLAAQPRPMDPAVAAARLARWRPRMPGVGVTNMGRLEGPAQYGEVTLEGFSGIPSLNVFSGLAFADAATLNGRLELNLVHAEPVMSRPRAERLAAGLLAHLEVETERP